jgi:hypothetical protein
MQQYSGGPNPFAIAGSYIGRMYAKGARSQRDSDQHTLTQTTLAMHAAQHEATTRQVSQQARLTEKSERGKHERAIHFANTIQGFAQPGAQVSLKHGDISASYTPKMSTPQNPGRVPVKKNRGGKKVP